MSPSFIKEKKTLVFRQYRHDTKTVCHELCSGCFTKPPAVDLWLQNSSVMNGECYSSAVSSSLLLLSAGSSISLSLHCVPWNDRVLLLFLLFYFSPTQLWMWKHRGSVFHLRQTYSAKHFQGSLREQTLNCHQTAGDYCLSRSIQLPSLPVGLPLEHSINLSFLQKPPCQTLILSNLSME